MPSAKARGGRNEKNIMYIEEFYKLASEPIRFPLEFSRFDLKVKTHPFQVPFIGEETQVKYICSSLNNHSSIAILGSPEANALTTAILEWNKKMLTLLPARMHVGPLRSLDASIACFHAMQIPEFHSILANLASPNEELVLVDLLREGQKTQTPEAVYYLHNFLPANVLLSINHVPDKTTPLGRKACLVPPNMEGINKTKVTTLLLSDSVASGTNQFFAFEYFFEQFPNLQQVIVLSAHLTEYGARALGKYLTGRGVKSLLVGFGALLESNPPEMYFSPTPVNKPEKFADERQSEIMKTIYGQCAEKLCVAGNWSAMFLSPRLGVSWFEKELRELGKGSDEILNWLPSTMELKSAGFSLMDFIPISTLIRAQNAGELELLKKELS